MGNKLGRPKFVVDTSRIANCALRESAGKRFPRELELGWELLWATQRASSITLSTSRGHKRLVSQSLMDEPLDE
jgi:hypothetical protein